MKKPLHRCILVHTSYSRWRCYFCKTLSDVRPGLELYDVAFQVCRLDLMCKSFFYRKVYACVSESVFLNAEVHVSLCLSARIFIYPNEHGRTCGQVSV